MMLLAPDGISALIILPELPAVTAILKDPLILYTFV